MNRLARLTQLIGVTSVPVLGVTWAGWTNATALVLYWCETLIFVLLVAALIHIHRLATKKRGHYCEMLVRTTTNDLTTAKRKIGYFGTTFLIFGVAFWLGTGMLLALLVRDETVDVDQLKQALPITALFLFIGLVIDMIGIRERPFAWISKMSQWVLWRVFFVQISIFVGFALSELFGLPHGILIVFVVLKVYTDIATQLPTYDPKLAPRWMVKLFGRSFAEDWRKSKHTEDSREAMEEEIFDGRPMPFEQTRIQRIDG
jgi:uncharacterized protein DUF6498